MSNDPILAPLVKLYFGLFVASHYDMYFQIDIILRIDIYLTYFLRGIYGKRKSISKYGR